MKKIALRNMRELKVDEPSPMSVKAASGLVKSGNNFLVVADDELSLFQFNFEGQTHLSSLQLKQGVLPENFKDRKKQKPDWEALTKIESKQGQHFLLAVPSGSTDNRTTGALITLNAQGLLDSASKTVEVDFSKLYSTLKEKLPELNIEGACVFNNRLKFFQRGNGASSVNAIIDLDLEGVTRDLMNQVVLRSENILSTQRFDLGTLGGFKLDFTDACTVDDTIWFLAVAEDSQSTYEDGQYHGAILGCLDSEGKELARYEIDCALKPEGLWVEKEEHRLCFYIVTDADNPHIHASIYFGKLL